MSLLVGFQHKKGKGGDGGAGIHPKKDFCCGDGYFGQKEFAEKVRKSRQNVNRDKSAEIVKIDKKW